MNGNGDRRAGLAREKGLCLAFYRRGRGGGRTGEGAAGAGREARGGRGLGTWLGHGDGGASRGACRGRAAPGELVWGESRGGQGGLAVAWPRVWPSGGIGVRCYHGASTASEKNRGRREMSLGALS